MKRVMPYFSAFLFASYLAITFLPFFHHHTQNVDESSLQTSDSHSGVCLLCEATAFEKQRSVPSFSAFNPDAFCVVQEHKRSVVLDASFSINSRELFRLAPKTSPPIL